jgi:hypothetical protein
MGELGWLIPAGIGLMIGTMFGFLLGGVFASSSQASRYEEGYREGYDRGEETFRATHIINYGQTRDFKGYEGLSGNLGQDGTSGYYVKT